jgi:hypothetical protein
MIGIKSMNASKKLEKSRGILAFAWPTESVDYVAIAEKTLPLASKKLDLPYTLITDCTPVISNQRYDIDTGEFVEWRNLDRYRAYELSPYDETLLIDVDLLILNDSLNRIWDTDWDYLCQRSVTELSIDTQKHFMGRYSLPLVWATVFPFRKTPRTKAFFDLVRRVQLNYGYYQQLFNLESRNFRNDFAFAIADTILNGYSLSTVDITIPLLNLVRPLIDLQLDGNNVIVREKDRAFIVPKMNLHVMSKSFMQSNQLNQFINNAST